MANTFLLKLLWAYCWTIGKLPQFLQFALGDFVFVIIYYLIGYRKKVVRENLVNSFPQKTAKELRIIEKKFYRQLSDIMIESLAMVSMSEKQIRKRMVFENPELLNSITPNRAVMTAMAHFGTWEYTVSSGLYLDAPVLAVYHPLSNKTVDEFYKKMRSRFGVQPVSMALTSKEIIRNIRAKTYPAVALIADQTPPIVLIKNWIPFLNQPTAFFPGMERLAVSLHTAVVFAHITKPKRGYYRCRFELLYDGEQKLEEFELTKLYAEKLENMITENPHLWLWSHRRWKLKPGDKIPR
ncbi:MAG: lysophospholipid acyltransferase family protein [Rikenellaceae bacterium]